MALLIFFVVVFPLLVAGFVAMITTRHRWAHVRRAVVIASGIGAVLALLFDWRYIWGLGFRMLAIVVPFVILFLLLRHFVIRPIRHPRSSAKRS